MRTYVYSYQRQYIFFFLINRSIMLIVAVIVNIP